MSSPVRTERLVRFSSGAGPARRVIGARAALKEARPDGYTVLVDIHTTGPMMIGA